MIFAVSRKGCGEKESQTNVNSVIEKSLGFISKTSQKANKAKIELKSLILAQIERWRHA